MKRKLYKIYLFIMQKWLIIPIIFAFFAGIALLVPRFSRYPERADDGLIWDRSWEMLGSVLGVGAVPEGFTLLNNDTALSGSDTYYASWVTGAPRPYTNAEGKDVDLYPAQIYLLLYGCADGAAAEAALSDWMDRERETYSVKAEYAVSLNGQPFQLMAYDCGSETNPYSRGVSGFSRLGPYVIVAELTCTAEYGGDERAILSEFLNGCHYGSAAIRR